MVKSQELENRAAESIRDAEAAIRKMGNKPEPGTPPATEQELADLKARIAHARTLPPPHPNLVDGRSWAMGRDAALAAIDGT